MTSGAIDNNSKRIQRTDQVHEKICVQAMYGSKGGIAGVVLRSDDMCLINGCVFITLKILYALTLAHDEKE